MAEITPAPNDTAKIVDSNSGANNNPSATQKPRQGAQLNGLKFIPNEYGILFIFQKVTKATDASNCIILFRFYIELLGHLNDNIYHPSFHNNQETFGR
jgi:hypothetical protein